MARDPEAVAKAAVAAASRIKDTARNRGTDAQKLIVRYTLERWLHRLTLTRYSGLFCLKGGMIMPLLGDESRPTEDIDGNFDEEMEPADVAAMVAAVCATDPSQEDGLVFDVSQSRVEAIRDGAIPGVRVTFDARLETRPRPTPVRVKLDLTYGDAITPSAVLASLPQSIKGVEAVVMTVYPWPTVVAEKIHAVQRHGIFTTRLKDFYDLSLIMRTTPLSGPETSAAISATFARWGGTPEAEQAGLSDRFARSKAADWKRFMAKGGSLKLKDDDFTSVVADIRSFALPLLEAASRGHLLEADWMPGEGWVDVPRPAIKV